MLFQSYNKTDLWKQIPIRILIFPTVKTNRESHVAPPPTQRPQWRMLNLNFISEVYSLEKTAVLGLFFSMEAWADFITSWVWSMLMFQVAWKRIKPQIQCWLINSSFMVWLRQKHPPTFSCLFFLKSRCSYHVVQSFRYAVVSGVDEVDFGALHSYRAAASDLPGHLQSSRHHGLLICKHSAGREMRDTKHKDE